MNDYLDINAFVDSLDSFDDFGVFGDVGNLDFASVGIEVKEEEEE
tara:strand:+ start:439 stop:573 length:135 start_codon:yes stop_codon:yes gene_type:complete